MALKNQPAPPSKNDAVLITVPYQGHQIQMSCVGRYSSYYGRGNVEIKSWVPHLVRSVDVVPATLLTEYGRSQVGRTSRVMAELVTAIKEALEAELGVQVKTLRFDLLDLE